MKPSHRIISALLLTISLAGLAGAEENASYWQRRGGGAVHISRSCPALQGYEVEAIKSPNPRAYPCRICDKKAYEARTAPRPSPSPSPQAKSELELAGYTKTPYTFHGRPIYWKDMSHWVSVEGKMKSVDCPPMFQGHVLYGTAGHYYYPWKWGNVQVPPDAPVDLFYHDGMEGLRDDFTIFD